MHPPAAPQVGWWPEQFGVVVPQQRVPPSGLATSGVPSWSLVVSATGQLSFEPLGRSQPMDCRLPLFEMWCTHCVHHSGGLNYQEPFVGSSVLPTQAPRPFRSFQEED